MLRPVALLTLLVFAISLTSAPMRAWAQSMEDDQDSDLGPDTGDEEFIDTGADSLSPLPGGGEDFTEGNQYVDETATGPGGVNLGARQAAARTRQEKQQLPQNALWGAGTGLLLGGWYALLNSGDNRTTLSSIGTGAVLGAILGIVVGVRTVINPETPVPPPLGLDTTPGGPGLQPAVALDTQGFKVGVQYNF